MARMTEFQLSLDQKWLDNKDKSEKIVLFKDEVQVWLTEIRLLKEVVAQLQAEKDDEDWRTP